MGINKEFESTLSTISCDEIRGSIITVADTMEICEEWFKSKGIEYTAYDLTAMTKMILKELKAAKKQTEVEIAWFKNEDVLQGSKHVALGNLSQPVMA